MFYKSIDLDSLPFSCLVDDSTVLLSSGVFLQVLEFEIFDYKLNSEGGFKDSLAKKLSSLIKNEFSFYIYTIKSNRIFEKTKYQHESDLFFLNELGKDFHQVLEDGNRYSTTVCVVICLKDKININFIKKIKSYFSISSYESFNLEFIENSIKKITKFSFDILENFDKYNGKILSSYYKKDKKYSELISFLAFLVNLKKKEYLVEDIDISKLINDEEFSFNDELFSIKNHVSGVIFSLKDKPEINLIELNDILSINSEIIICEFVNLNKEDKINSSLYFSLFDKKIENLKVNVKNLQEKFSKYGIIAVQENINLERIFYAKIAGNFRFLSRQFEYNRRNICSFVYSYNYKNIIEKESLFSKEILRFNSLKNNPINFYILQDNFNILISGSKSSGKTTMANIIGSRLKTIANTRIITLEFNKKSEIFINAIDGKYYDLSLSKNASAFFNILNVFRDNQVEQANYLKDIFSLFLSYANVSIDHDILLEVKNIITQIQNIIVDSSKIFALYDFMNIFKNSSLSHAFFNWHSIGKYYNLFDNKDDILDSNHSIGINIDSSFKNDQKLLDIALYHVMSKIISSAEKSNQKIAFILHDLQDCLDSYFLQSRIEFFFEKFKENNIFFISLIDNQRLDAKVNINSITKYFQTKFFIGDRFLLPSFKMFYDLEEYEFEVIKTLFNFPYSFLLKQNKKSVSGKINLISEKHFPILSSNQEFRTTIKKIQENISSNKSERWLPNYYYQLSNMTLENESNNVDDDKILEILS